MREEDIHISYKCQERNTFSISSISRPYVLLCFKSVSALHVWFDFACVLVYSVQTDRLSLELTNLLRVDPHQYIDVDNLILENRFFFQSKFQGLAMWTMQELDDSEGVTDQKGKRGDVREIVVMDKDLENKIDVLE